MINEELTIRIKSVLGFRYTSQILDYLDKRRIFNSLGTPYSRSYISEIVNGTRTNLIVEEAIITLCDDKIKRHTNLSLKKEELLKKEL
ncbi:hypothetical protein [Myroides odoratimimus]|uniref:Uncharacterized protein n=1 Tax=Myroides odoratimimus TaxID=76832 RepID=A0AAI8C342_9FLAO|nr:hypothetical protein [Myroides odoratimimus]ALU25239.1 hypothetical protein AS202_03295 [Myroides odoratimimus]